MERPTQTLENHARLVTGYHRVLAALLLVLVLWSVSRLITAFSLESFAQLVLVIALLVTAFYARAFPVGVQDRLIRLEERLRMERVLPEELRPRIGEFTTRQLIALRFASDEELPGLARRVLDEGLVEARAIKQSIRSWRADHQRI